MDGEMEGNVQDYKRQRRKRMHQSRGIDTRVNSICMNILSRRNQQLDILMRMWYVGNIPNIHRLIRLSNMFRAPITAISLSLQGP